MATTVNNAFKEFIKDFVDLDSEVVCRARKSRENLLSNIGVLGKTDEFFDIYQDKHLNYGSFARHTKLKPLDDIDLMVCISANGRMYNHILGNTYDIIANNDDIKQYLNIEGSDKLNSTKVINRFISNLSKLHDYRKAEMHKNGEAATLGLKSYEWNFDIVPCFYCDGDFYLIPNGKGKWKRTDPRVDKRRVSEINKKHNGQLLQLIRLIKYWNKIAATKTLESYLLENMILDRYENIDTPTQWKMSVEFSKSMKYLSSAIFYSVNDPKGIQGNLNNLSFEEQCRISEVLTKVHSKSLEACDYECIGEHIAAINIWRNILGYVFPSYMGA